MATFHTSIFVIYCSFIFKKVIFSLLILISTLFIISPWYFTNAFNSWIILCIYNILFSNFLISLCLSSKSLTAFCNLICAAPVNLFSYICCIICGFSMTSLLYSSVNSWFTIISAALINFFSIIFLLSDFCLENWMQTFLYFCILELNRFCFILK